MIDGSVYFTPIDSQFSSHGYAKYLNDLGSPASATLSGTHSVSGPSVFQTPVQGEDVYSYTLEGPAEPGACYGTRLEVTATPPGWFDTKSRTFVGETRCAPAPSGTTIDVVEKNAPTCGNPGECSPIVFNLGNGTYELTSVENGVDFDLAASGTPIRTAWTAAGEPLGFLALDRNENGRVDSGGELFGNATRLQRGQLAPHGFAALAEFDDNQDGVIDSSDSVWTALRVWTDMNHNGHSEPGELSKPAAAGITAIGVRCHYTGRVDRNGNSFRYQSRIRMESKWRPVYDIWFVTR